ncbi:hypothetical protein AB0F44_00825 [Nocardioides sp. NPDC023903]|uniref:hypothetical protein n=1 Tax=Nocardioides sp. NPDC023903 TaxID=3157195 RepID=UPI0033C10F9B
MSLLVRLPDHAEKANLGDLGLCFTTESAELTLDPSSPPTADVPGRGRADTFRHHQWRRSRALVWFGAVRNALRRWFSGPQQQVATLGLFVAAFGAVVGLIK